MKFSINHSELKDWEGESLIFGVHKASLEEQIKVLSDKVPNLERLAKRLKETEFNSKKGELVSFDLLDRPIEKIIFVGLGELKDLTSADLRKAVAISTRKTIGSKGTLGIILPWELFEPSSIAKATAESIRLAVFKDLRFQSDPRTHNFPENIDLIGLPEITSNIFSNVSAICSGVELARELVGAPPNSLTPGELAKEALKVARTFNLQSKILERKDCEKEGMGAFLAVSQGSDLEPKFIHLTYKPKGEIKRRIAMIGKGLTFDSGGYNLKVGASQIDMMKYDMGGSAAVIGAARAISEIAPDDTEVHFIVASCENMVNGSAVHPGDIVKASNGKTIEINNTDAEGRLTLADALVYACKLKPDSIVDLATLTGACVIALGEEIAGLWSNSDELSDELDKASNAAGEKLWRMPLHKSYKEGLKSMLADIKNTGPRAGGSITAALFLTEFLQDDIPWAHIDIAGTCWTDKDRGLDPSGATGYGVRTLVNWACSK